MYYFINFKNYKESTGANAIKLAKICERVANRRKARIIACVNAVDFKDCSKAVDMPVFSEHIDPIDAGAFTGWILPDAVKGAGAAGTLLNHSERRISFDVLKKSIVYCKKLKLKCVVCVEKDSEVSAIAKLKPDFIAIEPPELIGGKVSVSTAKPQVVSGAVKLAGKVPVLCGAGIHTKQDVIIAKKLGAKGILIASAVTLAKDPAKVLDELVI